MTTITAHIRMPRLRRNTVEDAVKRVVEKIKMPDLAAELERFLIEKEIQTAQGVADEIREKFTVWAGESAGVTVIVEKEAVSRSDRLSEALGEIDSAVEAAKEAVEGLRDEIETWKGNLEGTPLENTEKYKQLEECYDALDNLYSELENIEIPSADDVEFPSMY